MKVDELLGKICPYKKNVPQRTLLSLDTLVQFVNDSIHVNPFIGTFETTVNLVPKFVASLFRLIV